MKVLITTPNGKVGSEVAAQLLEKGVEVRVAAHTVAKAQAAFPNSEVVPFDFNNPDTWQAALEGITALYFAAPGDYDEAAPQTTFLDAAKAAGVQRVVRLSAAGVEQGESALRDVERHIEQSGLEYTILRPTWFMQNYSTSTSADQVRQGFLAEPSGDGATSFIDVRDIAAVAVKALTETGHEGNAYTLTGSEPLTRYQVAEKIGSVLGKEIEYTALTDEDFRAQTGPYISETYLEILSSLYGFIRAGYTAETTDNVQSILGRAPITFDEFASDHKAVWQA